MATSRQVSRTDDNDNNARTKQQACLLSPRPVPFAPPSHLKANNPRPEPTQPKGSSHPCPWRGAALFSKLRLLAPSFHVASFPGAQVGTDVPSHERVTCGRNKPNHREGMPRNCPGTACLPLLIGQGQGCASKDVESQWARPRRGNPPQDASSRYVTSSVTRSPSGNPLPLPPSHPMSSRKRQLPRPLFSYHRCSSHLPPASTCLILCALNGGLSPLLP